MNFYYWKNCVPREPFKHHHRIRYPQHSPKFDAALCNDHAIISAGVMDGAVQVLNHVWVVTRGGIIPKMLDPTVTRGAANVASVRRLRNLVHGAIALKSLRALKVSDDSMLLGSLHMPAVLCK